MRYYAIIGLLLGCALTLAGCGTANRAAERQIEQAAPRYIGPADRYVADVSGLTASSARQVRLTGYGVRPTPGLVLQLLVLDLHDVGYQRTPFRITRVGSAQFMAQLTDQEATAYLTNQIAQQSDRIPLSNVQINFLANAMRIAGVYTIAGVPLPASATGMLQAQGQRVLFLPQQITVANAAFTDQFRTAITRASNPLVDLSSLSFQPTIQTITLTPGLLTISGVADVNRLLGTP